MARPARLPASRYALRWTSRVTFARGQLMACQPSLAGDRARAKVGAPGRIRTCDPRLRRPEAPESPGPPETMSPYFPGLFDGGGQRPPTPDRDGVSHLCHTETIGNKTQVRLADRQRGSRARTPGPQCVRGL